MNIANGMTKSLVTLLSLLLMFTLFAFAGCGEAAEWFIERGYKWKEL